MTELSMGKNDAVRRIKIRNLNRILEKLQNGMTCYEYQSEDRDWYEGEREEIIEELVKTIGVLTNGLDS